jgi:hypothetical protein
MEKLRFSMSFGYQVFLPNENTWTDDLSVWDIAQAVLQGDISPDAEAWNINSEVVCKVAELPRFAEAMELLEDRKKESDLHGESVRLRQFEFQYAKRSAEELDEAIKDPIPPETQSVSRDNPANWNFHGSLTDGSLNRASELAPDDQALAEQFQELLSKQLETRQTSPLSDEEQQVGSPLADSLDPTPQAADETNLTEAQGKFPPDVPEVDQEGASVEPGKLLSEVTRIDSVTKPMVANEAAVEITQWGRVQKYDTKKKKGEVNVDGKMFSFALEDVARLTSPSRMLGSFARVRFVQTSRGFELISLDVRPDHDPEKEDIRQKIAGYRLELETLERRRQGSHGTLLTKWAEINIRDAARDLAQVASSRDESWSFKGRRPYGIAENYLRYTFYRLVYEDKIAFSENLACFNTGLSDKWNRPIYALFQRYKGKRRPQYRFLEFCIQGEGRHTFNFIHDFPVPPPPAQYVRELHHTFFDGNADIIIQEEHVIDDGIEAGRYPLKFLERHMPPSMVGKGRPNNKDEEWLKAYVRAINDDYGGQKKRDILAAINHAKDRARARTIQNFKTAIPCYYPDLDTISLLLPLCLLDDHTPDVALVLRYINKSASYGITVYSRELAYINARLVSRPMSEWLNPDIEPSDAGDRDLDVSSET